MDKFEERFNKLKPEVVALQEERAIRRAKWEWPIEFQQKGHEDQFFFNVEIEDRLEIAAKKMKKLNQATEKETYNKLKEGISRLAEHQKHIHMRISPRLAGGSI